MTDTDALRLVKPKTMASRRIWQVVEPAGYKWGRGESAVKLIKSSDEGPEKKGEIVDTTA